MEDKSAYTHSLRAYVYILVSVERVQAKKGDPSNNHDGNRFQSEINKFVDLEDLLILFKKNFRSFPLH